MDILYETSLIMEEDTVVRDYTRSLQEYNTYEGEYGSEIESDSEQEREEINREKWTSKMVQKKKKKLNIKKHLIEFVQKEAIQQKLIESRNLIQAKSMAESRLFKKKQFANQGLSIASFLISNLNLVQTTSNKANLSDFTQQSQQVGIDNKQGFPEIDNDPSIIVEEEQQLENSVTNSQHSLNQRNRPSMKSVQFSQDIIESESPIVASYHNNKKSGTKFFTSNENMARLRVSNDKLRSSNENLEERRPVNHQLSRGRSGGTTLMTISTLKNERKQSIAEKYYDFFMVFEQSKEYKIFFPRYNFQQLIKQYKRSLKSVKPQSQKFMSQGLISATTHNIV